MLTRKLKRFIEKEWYSRDCMLKILLEALPFDHDFRDRIRLSCFYEGDCLHITMRKCNAIWILYSSGYCSICGINMRYPRSSVGQRIHYMRHICKISKHAIRDVETAKLLLLRSIINYNTPEDLEREVKSYLQPPIKVVWCRESQTIPNFKNSDIDIYVIIDTLDD